MTPPRKIDLSVEVPGTPEEVWQAIATSPGITSWFIPITVEEREGGQVTLEWGDYGTETGKVTAWEPPHRFAYEGGGEEPLAYEWLVEARDGGTCIVRLVNSGFGEGSDWDGQYDGMSEGWPLFLENLRLQLERFAGRFVVRSAIPTVMLPGPGQPAWELLCETVGVRPDLSVGDRFETTGEGVPALAGTVAHTVRRPKVRDYHLVLDAPAPGTAIVAAEGDGDQVAASIYLYLHADADDEWTPWLKERFPAPAPDPADAPSG